MPSSHGSEGGATWFAKLVIGTVVTAVVSGVIALGFAQCSGGSSPTNGGGSGAGTAASGGGTPAPADSTDRPSPTPSPSSTPTPTPATSGDCQLTISHIGATIKESPAHDGQDIVRVPDGVYTTLSWQQVEWAGRPERWFEIAVGSRHGWIVDNTILIDAKSSGCP